MSKTETAQRYKSAQEVEAEAKQHAQMLADQTAIELEELARSMHSATNTLCEVMGEMAQQAKASVEISKNTAALLTTTADQMRVTGEAWERTANRFQLQLSGQSRRLLAIVTLSAAVASVSAGLLNHYWPASIFNQSTPPTISIDTDRLASEIIGKWRLYQQPSTNAKDKSNQ